MTPTWITPGNTCGTGTVGSTELSPVDVVVTSADNGRLAGVVNRAKLHRFNCSRAASSDISDGDGAAVEAQEWPMFIFSFSNSSMRKRARRLRCSFCDETSPLIFSENRQNHLLIFQFVCLFVKCFGNPHSGESEVIYLHVLPQSTTKGGCHLLWYSGEAHASKWPLTRRSGDCQST